MISSEDRPLITLRKWSLDQLRGKLVAFKLAYSDGGWKGEGVFRVMREYNGQVVLCIDSTRSTPVKDVYEYRYFPIEEAQEILIERCPDVNLEDPKQPQFQIYQWTGTNFPF